MSSMKPGKAYVPNGSVNTPLQFQPVPGVGTVGNANAKGALPAKNGGKGRKMTSEGPLKPAFAKKASSAKRGRK